MGKELEKIMARMRAEVSEELRKSDTAHYQASLMIEQVRRWRFDDIEKNYHTN